ncbi:hypothetical protein [Polyangium sp. y55x31]|uniref:hypothetical protein n=1 Tax=Polyangium sp. y55x31 TaxID=3042688 RepID=UPI00248313A4|nr:hypothetical protein [Polyangium sp. y55x31]MDI1483202.1 hypothetical protein [Polyangium sp. y55x31]
MKRTMLGFLGIAALAFAGLGACGGKVVIDAGGAGEGGAGAGGSGSAGTNTTTNGTGTGGGSQQSLCEQACASLGMVPECADPNCLDGCLAEFQNAGDCLNEVTAAVQCIAENAGMNGECFGSVCAPLIQAIEDCKNPGSLCGANVCSEGSDGSCKCEGQCNGSQVSTECFPQPGTTQVCVCSINGMQVGKCDATLGSFACGVTEGCCAQFFF